jgi:hypothetical protein
MKEILAEKWIFGRCYNIRELFKREMVITP